MDNRTAKEYTRYRIIPLCREESARRQLERRRPANEKFVIEIPKTNDLPKEAVR